MHRWLVALVASFIAVATAVVVNLATADLRHNVWAWVAVGVLACAGAGVTVWGQRVDAARAQVTASGTRSVAAGGSIATAVTGDRSGVAPQPGPAQQPPGATMTSRSAQAPGDRAVAAGGDIGMAVTGDDSAGPTAPGPS